MKHTNPFALAGMNAFIGTKTLADNPNFGYTSRGKGEGLPGNKHAKSSFKQNKCRGF